MSAGVGHARASRPAIADATRDLRVRAYAVAEADTPLSGSGRYLFDLRALCPSPRLNPRGKAQLIRGAGSA